MNPLVVFGVDIGSIATNRFAWARGTAGGIGFRSRLASLRLYGYSERLFGVAAQAVCLIRLGSVYEKAMSFLLWEAFAPNQALVSPILQVRESSSEHSWVRCLIRRPPTR